MCYLLRDSTNLEDSNAVAVKNGSGTVGHVLFNLAPHFLGGVLTRDD